MAGFENTYILLLLLLIIPAIYIYKKIIEKKKKQAIKFSNIAFIKSALGNQKKIKRNNLLFYLAILVVVFIVIGFSNPHIPLKRTKKGVNVVLVIDVSGSMQAKDYKPSRITAAKEAGKILINSLKKNDYVGIISFESGATTTAYLSPFKEKTIEKLESLKAKQGRTAIGDGLSLGVEMADSIPNKKKVVILISDGVNNAGVISPQEAINFAKLNHIQVYTVGMGSKGKTVLGYDWMGNPVYAELDETTLKNIAKTTNGEYYKSVDEKTLSKIYKKIGKNIKREREETNIKDWFFVLALLTQIVYLYLRFGKMVIQ